MQLHPKKWYQRSVIKNISMDGTQMEQILSGKTIVITGATSGIGLAAAEIAARKGAAVIGIGRSPERCRQAEARLRAFNPAASSKYLTADLSIQSQVRSLAPRIQLLLEEAGRPGLDGLVNNAGTFSYYLSFSPEGFELQWAVNHLAPFLLTHDLLPLLQAASAGRIVTVSSESHRDTRLNWDDIQLRRHYNGLRAYQQTKLANVLFTLELNRRLGTGSGVRAFAADPGLVKTEIGFKGTPALVRWVWGWRRSAGDAPELPAAWIVYLLSEPSLQQSPEIYWRGGVPKPASRFALDAQSARRLWALSAQMCGLESEA